MECCSSSIEILTADLEVHVLSNAIEQVYNAFFYTTSMHLLQQQSEAVLFGHFVTTLNAAFESKLALEDKGYESVSENFYIPTPLRCTSKIYHVSSDDNISFDPSTPCSTATSQSHREPVCHHLSFSSSEDEECSVVDTPSTYSITPPQNPMDFAQQLSSKSNFTMCDDLAENEEEDFQTVTLDDDHWTATPDRHLCIH